MNTSSTGPAARATAQSAEQQQREHDELDPARHHDRRHAGRRVRGRRPQRRRPRRRRLARDRPPPVAVRSVLGLMRAHPSSMRPTVLARRVTAILFVGDIVAPSAGARCSALLPGLREELALDFVVANGENAAGGIGITPEDADELFAAGVDVITLGNHTYRHREVYPYLDQQPDPAPGQLHDAPSPGHGTCVVERDGASPRRREPHRATFHADRRAGVHGRSTRRCARSRAPTTCSSTCTPRRRARRSRWAGTSTAA